MARITVEDCLKKVPSRFALVLIASARAKSILKGASPLADSENRAIVTALREIAAGKVSYDGTNLPVTKTKALAR